MGQALAKVTSIRSRSADVKQVFFLSKIRNAGGEEGVGGVGVGRKERKSGRRRGRENERAESNNEIHNE